MQHITITKIFNMTDKELITVSDILHHLLKKYLNM